MESWEKATKQHQENCLERQIKIHCLQCEKIILVSPSYARKKYCSRKCLIIYRKLRSTKIEQSGDLLQSRGQKPRKGKIIGCLYCKKEIYKNPFHFNKHKKAYCSQKCFQKDLLKGENLNCKVCKKEYHRPPSQIRLRGSSFCSYECMHKYQKGKQANSWKGGVALKKSLWRYFSEYIRRRDEGMCISCGVKKHWKEMDAGHYIPKTAGMSLYFDERNVNAQCTYCNRYMHGNLSRYAIALRKKYGNDILEILDSKRRATTKFTPEDYSILIAEYKKKIMNLINY